MSAWRYYFYLRRLGYAPHMAYLCAAMSAAGMTSYEFHRRLERVARRMNTK